MGVMVSPLREETIQANVWVHGALVDLFLFSVPLVVGMRLKDALTALFDLISVLLTFRNGAKRAFHLKLLCSYILLASLMRFCLPVFR